MDKKIELKSKKVYFMYQKIVDVEVLLKEYFNQPGFIDNDEAAGIMHHLLRHYNSPDEVSVDVENFTIKEKEEYLNALDKGVERLEQIFFEKFRILYKIIRGR